MPVYCCRQYFIIIYKEKPLEIWDLKNLCLLREMPANFPILSALVSILLNYTKRQRQNETHLLPIAAISLFRCIEGKIREDGN